MLIFSNKSEAIIKYSGACIYIVVGCVKVEVGNRSRGVWIGKRVESVGEVVLKMEALVEAGEVVEEGVVEVREG